MTIRWDHARMLWVLHRPCCATAWHDLDDATHAAAQPHHCQEVHP